ncbi:hypothetical protein PYW08_004201 [Mythimna loreyi]|uniref:Uncharacterized protein n=1 Tax=Mythimna loreyi TaxID=667449 RepID=A0ACC2QNK0_9NEOP|nr:hypothetical protein PYW08_004201 [Mythimna loreyi]
MPAKCGGCGKFVSASDSTKCTKCGSVYHRTCVGLPAKGPATTIGQCPECRRNVRRDNKAETPVRGLVTELQKEESAEVQLSTPPPLPVSSPVVSPPPDVAAPPSAVVSHHDIPQDVGAALRLVAEELRTLKFEVLELRRDVAEIKAANESCHIRMDGIESRLEVLEKRQCEGCVSSADLGVVEQLKRDLNDRDQELMSNDVVITNVPEALGENTTHLLQLIGTKLGVTVEDRDIVCAERAGGRHIKATSPSASAEPRPRPIIVRLARRDQRDALLNGARVRRGATTENLGISGKPVRFYVNERLTRQNQQLFRQTRAAAGIHGWRFVWSRRGRILARCKPGDPIHRIASEEDIEKFMGPF